ncbi:MAG: hypothetical protein ACKOPO_06485 [Novosphingobium sp.]
MTIFAAKMFIERSIAFHNDALHAMAGVVLALLAAAVLRRSVAHALPWLVVLVIELVNEANDYFFEPWPNDVARQFGEIAKDIGLTMALPTLLLIVARLWPQLLTGEPVIPTPEAAPENSLAQDDATI